MTFLLPEMPFPYDALEPAISAKALELHHGTHHAGYVDKLNKAVTGTPREDEPLEGVVLWASKDDAFADVFNNAAQAWNHAFFWASLSPSGGGRPDGALFAEIEKSFGSYGDFRRAFIDAGAGQFGSGWVWLVVEDGKLKIVSTQNADTPIAHSQFPLMTCDVWEHAYYLDYQSRRPEFLEAFIDGLVDWKFAARQFAALKGDGKASAWAYADTRQPETVAAE